MSEFSDDKIKQLPVRFKAPVDEQLMLIRREDYKCFHQQVLVDPKKAEVECRLCGEKLNPMWVLNRLAGEETRWHEARKNYQAEMKRLNERRSTKCNHCGKMTRISRR